MVEPGSVPSDRAVDSVDDKGRIQSPLSELLSHVAQHTASNTAYPELAEMEYFRQAWDRLRNTELLRHTRVQVPGNAGPLNSSSLIHRSLSLMREQSPGYLKHFLAYLDALSWMEELTGRGQAKKGGRGRAR